MSDSSAFGFGKFIPGFDFLQNLSKAGQGAGGMPPFAHWVAPTVSVEEVEKRIEELKAVQFWLEQNSRALAATVQALEVQRMTLSTLKGMNVNLSDVAKAFSFAAPTTTAASQGDKASSPLADWPMSASAAASTSAEPVSAAAATPEPDLEPAAQATAEADKAPDAADGSDGAATAPAMAQAMQWWGALTQQFQQIAQQAMQDPVQHQAMFKASQMGTELAQTAVKTASEMVRQAVSSAPSAAQAQTPAKQAGAGTTSKASAKAVKKVAPKPAAQSKAVVKKAVLADKKPTTVATPSKAAAAKKSTVSKPRSR